MMLTDKNIYKKKLMRNEKGFTLIEIIAVLIILGILTAVAVPKYLSLQDQARQRALEGAIAEGMSTVNIAYGKMILSTGSTDGNAIATKAGANSPESDEFSYGFAGTTATVLVTVSGKAGSDFAGESATKNWSMP